MAAVGMAVDYSRVNAARTAFQVSLDATALMLSKDAATETKEALQTEATKTFNSLFSRSEVTDVNVTPLYTSAGGSKLTLNGTGVVHTNFLGVIGIAGRSGLQIPDGHHPADRRPEHARPLVHRSDFDR
jgi:Flp pilus assembly protein TadG